MALPLAGVVAKSAATIPTAAPAAFVPRQVFDVSPSIARSYFLGHHKSALTKMSKLLHHVGLIIECRDFRVPLTSWNPLLEQKLAANPAERARIIVYTKCDLGPDRAQKSASQQSSSDVIKALREFHRKNNHASAVLFLRQSKDRGRGSGPASSRSSHDPGVHLIDAIKRVARESFSLTGLRCMVVGMPNAGKSTLLNRLRGLGVGLGKAAKTGGQPGVTKKLATPVRIAPAESSGVPGSEGLGEGVFLIDTPGVSMPYISRPEDMIKLALVNCVKDNIVPHVIVADYLLYHLNLVDPALYAARFCDGVPTNDVLEFLRGVARRTGKLGKGGVFNIESAADWVVQEWRRGGLGRFLLDAVTPETLSQVLDAARKPALSMNQAKKQEKEVRKTRNEMKRMGLSPSPVAGGSA